MKQVLRLSVRYTGVENVKGFVWAYESKTRRRTLALRRLLLMTVTAHPDAFFRGAGGFNRDTQT